MKDRNRVKITVLKKLSADAIYGSIPNDVAPNFNCYCPKFIENQEFIVEEDGTIPKDFCSWAWHDILHFVSVLRLGGRCRWTMGKNKAYACCSDGLRPVFFKIERLEE